MDREDILSILRTQPSKERPQTFQIRNQAHSIIISLNPSSNIEQLPTTLLDLLTQIIKPLFTGTKHPQLTSTGRKSLVPPPPPSIATTRFLNDPLDEDGDVKPWKTPFTIPLLEYILKSYMLMPYDPPSHSLRKSTIESHFHLLIPPILNMIDDPAPTPYKSAGCHCLQLLCAVLSSTQSEMLKRTGLADVFVDALKTNFLLLPTLTPEDESLAVLCHLYPAFLGLIDARFIKLTSTQAGTWTGEKPDSGTTSAMGEEFVKYQELLTSVYRHGIMASLSHLSTSSDSLANTSSVRLSTLLLYRIPDVFRRMGIHAVKHFQILLPMVRVGLMDPFVLAAPEMVFAILDVLETVIEAGRPRVKEKWWAEILRGVLGCWVNCVDERDGNKRRNKRLEEIMVRLNGTAKILSEIVGPEEWDGIVERLVQEEADVQGLFET